MTLCEWLYQLVKHCGPPRLKWTLAIPLKGILGTDRVQITGVGNMSLTMTDTQKVSLTISPLDARGNPARVDGIPTWAASDPALLLVLPEPSGLGAVAIAIGGLGNAQVTVTADVDLGAGVREITGILDITIVGGEAVELGIVAGTPTEQ
jgi:hypothetical protein